MMNRAGILLVPALAVVLVLGGCAVHRRDASDIGKARSDKVYVCHKGKKTLHLADAAVRAHLNHGDRLGHCR